MKYKRHVIGALAGAVVLVFATACGSSGGSAVIRKYAPALGTPSSPLNSEVTQAYASGVMFEAAVKAGGSAQVTPESVKKGLYSFRDETFGGLTVPLTFTPGQPAVSNCFFTYQIENGAFTEPNGLRPICAPDSVVASMAGKFAG
jgi:branched-chain amino acid transport system substrate-binding protein